MTGLQDDPKLMQTLISMQQGEITEHHIYKKIASAQKDPHNREVLERISKDELGHYAIWKGYTHQDVAPVTLRIWYYYLIARVFGITFAIKLLENVEKPLRELVDGLHRRGMRIVLDASFNHCHPRFFAFQDLVQNGPDSRYKDWFTVHEWPVRVKYRPHLAEQRAPRAAKGICVSSRPSRR